MTYPNTPVTRIEMKNRLLKIAQTDSRIVGLVDYGSSSEGRADEWSDVDVAIFIRNADYEKFERGWKSWAAQLGPLLLAYIGGVGNPWTVFAGEPIPLRMDFDFYRGSEVEKMLTWPNSPINVESMVWYDDTGGKITACARQMVGRSLGPADAARAFEQVCGDFWYYILRTHVKMQRKQTWAAREGFNFTVTGNLLALLKLESGMTDRWQSTSSAENIERAITAKRLRQLNACIAGIEPDELRHALYAAAQLGVAVCQSTETQYGWPWPKELAEHILAITKGAASA